MWNKTTANRKPLDNRIAKRLRHTHRNPAEWVGTLTDGRIVYVVQQHGKLLVTTGSSLNEVLRLARDGKGEKVSHGVFGEVSTSTMLEATGLGLTEDVVVNDRVPGDLL